MYDSDRDAYAPIYHIKARKSDSFVKPDTNNRRIKEIQKKKEKKRKEKKRQKKKKDLTVERPRRLVLYSHGINNNKYLITS